MISEKLSFVEQRDFYGLLGVTKDASASDIKTAYFKLAKQLHPDVVARTGLEDMRKACERVFKTASEAFAILSHPEKRAAYEKSLRPDGITGNWQSAAVPVSQELEELLNATTDQLGAESGEAAKILCRSGAKHHTRGEYDIAELLFRRAFELEPENAQYAQKLGWNYFKMQDMEGARTYLEKSVKRAPYDAEIRFRMALYWKEVGAVEQQRRELEAVLRADDRHSGAVREMARLNQEERQAREEAATHHKPALLSRIKNMFKGSETA